MIIRNAETKDLPALLELRNHFVADGYATFDEEPLTPHAVAQWFAGFRPSGPHRLLVACDGSDLLGYCSSQSYRTHPAFRLTVETSVYVSSAITGHGVGSALYNELFAILSGQGLHRAVVGIALPNDRSLRLHSKFGFRPVGIFSEYAVKHRLFISSQWMERPL